MTIRLVMAVMVTAAAPATSAPAIMFPRSAFWDDFKDPFKWLTVRCCLSRVSRVSSNVLAGSFYDASVSDSGGSSAEFPSLDSSNFPALPSSNHGTGTRCRPPEQPQQRRDSNEPIILEFARLPRAHRLQVRRRQRLTSSAPRTFFPPFISASHACCPPKLTRHHHD
jgi:hypothetical protein